MIELKLLYIVEGVENWNAYTLCKERLETKGESLSTEKVYQRVEKPFISGRKMLVNCAKNALETKGKSLLTVEKNVYKN